MSTLDKVVVDGAVVANDWVHADAVPADDGANVILPLNIWLENKDALAARAGNSAPKLVGTDNFADLLPHIDGLDMIALAFPAFADGRCYSYAMLLRTRHGYTGELRAVGDVLRDQMFYMKRVGINAFEVRADRDAEDAIASLSDFSEVYQASVDQPLPLFKRI